MKTAIMVAAAIVCSVLCACEPAQEATSFDSPAPPPAGLHVDVCGDALSVDMITAERLYRAVAPGIWSEPADWDAMDVVSRKVWLESIERFLGDAACGP